MTLQQEKLEHSQAASTPGKKQFELKDEILVSIAPSMNGVQSGSSHFIAKAQNIEEYLVINMLDTMQEDGFVTNLVTSGKTRLHGRIASITAKGLCFIDDGGYRAVESKKKWSKYWVWAKTGAAILNALLVIGIAAWGIMVQAASNKQQEDVEFRRELREISSLLLQVIDKSKTGGESHVEPKK